MSENGHPCHNINVQFATSIKQCGPEQFAEGLMNVET